MEKKENKKWLICANALLAEITGMKVIDPYKKMRGLGERWVRSEGYDILIQLVKHFPTVDAVEVVHGRWEDMWDGKYANPRYRCSVCKEKANYKSVQDELLSWHDVQVLTPYCPYCLAKLDGGIDNDIKTV